tara:strand:+ start:74 stop:481 length:408 start_codon:yes stop_codon:yes gene_type:complete
MKIKKSYMRLINVGLLTLLIILICSCYVVTKDIEPLVSSINGKVIKGEGLGKQFGYKTSNLKIKEELPCGAYNGKSQYGKTTIISNGKGHVEAHIHDYNKDIYGETLKVKEIKLMPEFKDSNTGRIIKKILKCSD